MTLSEYQSTHTPRPLHRTLADFDAMLAELPIDIQFEITELGMAKLREWEITMQSHSDLSGQATA